jgi:hypothetical protein
VEEEQDEEVAGGLADDVGPARSELMQSLTDHLSADDLHFEEPTFPLFLDQVLNLEPSHPAMLLGAGRPSGLAPDTAGEACSVAVVLRCRPMLAHEQARGLTSVVKCEASRHEVRVAGKGRLFHFARVYDEGASQRKVFHETVAPLVEKASERVRVQQRSGP